MKKKHNNEILALLVSIIISMICLTYASVPLYRIFCKVTGYGGTTRQAQQVAPRNKKAGSYSIKVRFSADTHGIPLSFYPEQPYVVVTPGIQKLAFYVAENQSDREISGTAVYNVTPTQAGKYFNKVACFCFSQQTFAPRLRLAMPVSFFIDPAIEEDPTTRDIREITLSYTFFPNNTEQIGEKPVSTRRGSGNAHP
ncbi:cytochrome c oxidase assembly protein [Anaplasma capra]|uniref:cytochrome c oxidase assembly protein n=1 Tax=Anaplasma capra TaxID=1562740 RepID=UPI0021D5DC56|nr:cytochrome c oxidase assembly protein [Anaplasma capra]MCU7611292.1 cytochrome c oxidase assembly protein [Anaplasma capra]MCU7612721.1 cytochrome c oxidase assembly protein [Anaplasma capra]